MLPGAGNRSVITAGDAKAAGTAGFGMPETIAVTLAALWLLGLVSSYTMRGYIHVLLVSAVLVVIVRVIHQERLEPSDFL